MHFSDLLLQKLDSDLEINARVRLANNAFTLPEFGGTHKEEVILLWFLRTYANSSDNEDRGVLLQGFHHCLSSDYMESLSVSDITLKTRTEILGQLQLLLKGSEIEDSKLLECTLLLLRCRPLLSHLRKYPKECCQVFSAILNQKLNSDQTHELLGVLYSVFNNNPSKEKFVKYFIKKSYISFVEHSVVHENNALKTKLTYFFHNMVFRKCVIEFDSILKSVRDGTEISVKTDYLSTLIQVLHEVFVSECDSRIKELAYQIVFEGFAASVKSENNNSLCGLFLLMCHLIGLEEQVLVKSSEDVTCSVLKKDSIESHFKVSSVATDDSLTVLASLLSCLSHSQVDLNETLPGGTFLTWLQQLVLIMLKNQKLSLDHLYLLNICCDLNPSIIESNIKLIFTGILSQNPKVVDENFRLSYNKFFITLLEMYGKLQRIEKLILQFLLCMKKHKTKLDQFTLLPSEFLCKFTDLLASLPSGQLLTIMECLLDYLDVDCVKVLEEKEGKISPVLTQVTSELMTAFLCGVRILGHSVPKKIFSTFMANMTRLKETLRRFGVCLLQRTHDREFVRPFFKLCLYWGEIQILIEVYSSEQGDTYPSRDTAPTDLSILHSYLDGEQWSVLAERVSNFGAGQCNELFLKLTLQKLRFSLLGKDQTSATTEGTAKYILVQLSSELYKHNIVEELTTEDLNLILKFLTAQQSKLLVQRLIVQLFELKDDERKLREWIRDAKLQENKRFVLHAFSGVLKEIGSVLEPSDFQTVLTCQEFFDENDELSGEKFSELIGIVNSFLTGENTVQIKRKKLSKIADHVQVLKMLPLAFLNEGVRSLAFTCLTGLAVHCAKDGGLIETLLQLSHCMLTVGVDTNTCLDIGLCIKWLIEFQHFRNETESIRRNMIDCLIKSSTEDPETLEDVGKLVEVFSKKKKVMNDVRIEALVLLYQGFGKVFMRRGKNFGKRTIVNDLLGDYRQKLRKSITKQIDASPSEEDLNSSDVLLQAYGIELQRVAQSKDPEEKSKFIALNFKAYFEAAVKNVKNGTFVASSSQLLSTVLHLMPQIRKDLPKGIFAQIWNVLKHLDHIKWGLFYDASSTKEFVTLSSELFDMTMEALLNSEVPASRLRTCFQIWESFCDDPKNKKFTLACEKIHAIFDNLQSNIFKLNEITEEKFISLLKFLRFCCTKIEITKHGIDNSVNIILGGPFEKVSSVQEFHDMSVAALEVISALWLFKREEASEKIHISFQMFVFFLKAITTRSNSDLQLSDEDIQSMADCSFYLEKWTSLIAKSGKGLNKISAYFIAEVVSSFVSVLIYPVVKVHLTNCINNFLSISDEHVPPYLLRVLPAGCEQVFTMIHDQFRKYHRFNGRV